MIATFEEAQNPVEVARCRLRLAEATGSRGDLTAARGLLAQVRDVAEGLGARPLLAAALSQPGGEARTSDPRATTSTSTTLTPREREVLALVAAGRTNGEIAARLFISTKTASVHVSNILAKLGVSSRTQAAIIATRERLLD